MAIEFALTILAIPVTVLVTFILYNIERRMDINKLKRKFELEAQRDRALRIHESKVRENPNLKNLDSYSNDYVSILKD